ncbi:Histidinol dehydrogenase [Aquirufa nivalisilvae]|uniref:Histidinol dehydrogenase n=1 Tax=Aquirufa nivalisilvae TaxID=2516557 RepID=A0A2S2DVZ9_9BACT|nr:histidinol dehydrogenase [Aquirufa nivalisilvae]AWL09220.1 Histidinol dehydrogenase [Aquirufa nivalisilvae]MCZ2480283.1 histidinol dehydrogenase [Aquirufa nivalisilvae]
MIPFIKYPSVDTFVQICQRPSLDAQSLDQIIEGIFTQVETQQDQALRDLTLKFEKREIQDILYSQQEISELADQVPASLKKAIQQAYANIHTFHESQQFVTQKIETSPGVVCWQKASPIEKVGIYIPGGTAPLFSTILMLAIPAQIAGCKEIVLCTPAVHPAIFYTAQLCGVTKMAKVGGAQAIAAMALGTESIPKVYKIFGPGNQYVTAAKMYANHKGIAIDMPAGPSEVAVYADKIANPAYVAADLLSQAEHGVDSQVFLVALEETFIEKTQEELEKQVQLLDRKDLALQALTNSKAILVKDRQEAIQLLNEYAAEHLILACDQPEEFADHIVNAGSIFLGNFTPEAAGDYASGTNHTLPTNGFAKAYSGVNLASFQKKITLQSISQAGLEVLGQSIIDMAEAESLQAHANAVAIRLNTRS